MDEPTPEEISDLVEGMLERAATETPEERRDRQLRMIDRYLPEEQREEMRDLTWATYREATQQPN